MKRVLIITYYWPPAGGSGVQRWLKFAKYLPEFGWQPVIYTPSNPHVIITDESLVSDISPECEVIKRKIIEPYGMYGKLIGKNLLSKGVNPISKGRKSFKEKLSLWIRANMFIPDPRCLWIKPSFRFLKNYLKEHPVDAIVSTGPPHSMHLIAIRLHFATGIPWIADFRDPWTDIFYFKHLPLTRSAEARHTFYERSVLINANAVITVSDYIKKQFLNKLYGPDRSENRLFTIPNGYDTDDFLSPAPPLEEVEGEEEVEDEFTITHTGLFATGSNLPVLWRVLRELTEASPSFNKRLRIRLIGKIDTQVVFSLMQTRLDSHVVLMGYRPHKEVIYWQQRADVLLLPLIDEPEAAGILTGKFFEYLAASKPIMAFGPLFGELALALKKTSAGHIFDRNDECSIRNEIQKLFDGSYSFTPNKEAISEYSRKSLTASLVKILESTRDI